MTKEAGLNDRLYVNGFDLSGDVGALQAIGVTLGEQDVTGINKSARERLQLLGDGVLQFNNFFTGTGASGAHERLKTLSTTALATYCRGATVGQPAASLLGSQFSYELERGQDGSLLGTVEVKASGGAPLQWGQLLTVADEQFDTGAGDTGTIVDLGASHGIDDMVFTLHCTEFDGTDATFLIQDDTASDLSSAATYGTFTQITAVNAYERLAVAGAPNRYIRVYVSGTFTTVTAVITAHPLYD